MNTPRLVVLSFLLKLFQNLLLLLLLVSDSVGKERKIPITFQLQSSITGIPDLSGLVPGIDVALDIINENSTVLPEYQLQYNDIVDAQCGGTSAVRGFIDHVTGPGRDTELFIMGADCSVASEPIASLAPFWNLAQISTASTSPRLSNSRAFPTFMRPLASDASIASGFIDLMRYNGWRHFAIISQEEELFTLTRDALRAEASRRNIQILETTSFPTDHSPQNAVQELRESSGRIMFLNMYPEYALEILCQAFGLGMTTPEYAWITHAWFYDDFWTTRYYQNRSLYQPVNNCTDENMMRIANQIFVIDHYPMLDSKDSSEFIGGLTLDMFHELYEEKRNVTIGEGHPDLAVQARITYDAMWLAALALDKVNRQLKTMSPPLSLSDFNYSNPNGTIIKTLFYQTALDTSFDGASGQFKLLQNGDREPELRYYQYRPVNGTLKRVYVGITNQETKKLEIFPDKLPLFTDGMPVSYLHQEHSLSLFIVYTILCVVGIAFAVVCLVFSIVFRNKKLVKLSSPNLNIVFIAGIILMYILVILLGIEDELVEDHGVNALCQLRIWIGTIAFTLAYGSVVAKSFRVYYIFKNLKVQKKDKKTKTIQDWHMFLLIGVAILVDLIFLTTVTAVPTARLRLNRVELPPTNGEIPREIEVCSSESSSIWLPILIGFKAGEVVLSLFFVFENRKIKIKELIDNRVILFSVYTIVVACVALTPIIVLLYQDVDTLYGVMGAIMMLTVTVLLCINFVPKMYALKQNPSGEVKLDLSSVVANMSTSKSTVRDKKTQLSSVHSVEADLSVIKDDSVLNDKGSGGAAGGIEYKEAEL